MERQDPDPALKPALMQFDMALAEFARARRADPKASSLGVLERSRLLMTLPGGFDALYRRVRSLESAGIFGTSDWARPGLLQPALAKHSLRAAGAVTTIVEALSELRMLAVTRGDYFHPGISAEQARHFLTQVMALNLDLLSGQLTEADRERPKQLGTIVLELYRYLVSHLGYESLLDSLVDEVWRLLDQGPVQVDSICEMIGQIAKCLYDPEMKTRGNSDATRLVKALFAPTPASAEDPGLAVYEQRLKDMDDLALSSEASSFARSMFDTGLASPYHAVMLRFLRDTGQDELIPNTLGLTMTGLDDLYCYTELVHALIDEAIYPETCQAVYGLTMMLERGSLFTPSVAQALWRQIKLQPSAETNQALAETFGDARPPRVFLLAGVINLLGQPLGVGQGNNPTCQSAIGLSMWASNEADYLLQVLAWAARDNEVLSRFEGQEVSSRDLEPGLVKGTPVDVDPVSLVLIPHLDRLYGEMWRRCENRDEDAHRWINPEFYGWWVSHGFRAVTDVKTGEVHDYEGFIRHFYASYHPFYNGNIPVIHAQPSGIAVTDSAARFVGRHAINILRVALSPKNEMRVYFFNPNNDSGQNWGQGITCSTHGNGEFRGEASLPIAEFTSRLYAFHFDPLELGELSAIPDDEVARVMDLGYTSWASPTDGSPD
ncbi:hypothetical protein [Marinobacter salsuginis]|uniref:hypothetical protein n=1 Tax=Marinobacter salsuginis TaxID=418719 RepID=UPI001ADFF156|nr:hypothetical protein [Marinobacter salsuginis]QTN41414.1 hypothetical protein HZ997_17500 [Marinobacter salsuginis]